MSKKKESPNEPEFQRLLQFARVHVGKAFRALRADAERRERSIIVVFSPWDPLARQVYCEIASSLDGNLPPEIPYSSVSVIACDFEGFLLIAGQHYDMTGVRDRMGVPGPDRVRLALLTNGAMSTRNLEGYAVDIPRGLVRSGGGEA